jgi:hypothetical protein
MVERWLKNKYLGTLFHKNNNSPHHGIPRVLFKDNDKDGVPNVFDCKPNNKKKQDVMIPMSTSGGLNELYGRQENSRQLREYRKLEEARLKELQRIAGEQRVIDKSSVIYQYYPVTFGKEKVSGFVGASGISGATLNVPVGSGVTVKKPFPITNKLSVSNTFKKK